MPPAHSAKKVDGERAYVLARRATCVDLPPVEVTAHALSLGLGCRFEHRHRRLEMSAGYYVRSLARDLGARWACPAHLAALQRTGSGSWSLDDAHSLAEVVQSSPEEFLDWRRRCPRRSPTWPRCTSMRRRSPWSCAGARRPDRGAGRALAAPRAARRLVDEPGGLVALATPRTACAVHADIVLADL